MYMLLIVEYIAHPSNPQHNTYYVIIPAGLAGCRPVARDRRLFLVGLQVHTRSMRRDRHSWRRMWTHAPGGRVGETLLSSRREPSDGRRWVHLSAIPRPSAPLIDPPTEIWYRRCYQEMWGAMRRADGGRGEPISFLSVKCPSCGVGQDVRLSTQSLGQRNRRLCIWVSWCTIKTHDEIGSAVAVCEFVYQEDMMVICYHRRRQPSVVEERAHLLLFWSFLVARRDEAVL